MRTRQQRLADERAGHPPSPPQALIDNPRGPRRTRAKTPSATVAAGPVVPAAQSAAQGEPQALVKVWVDSARAVDDPSHQLAIPSALVPELLAFVESIRHQGNQSPVATYSSSSVQVTPSLERRRFAPGSPTSRTEPQLQETSQALGHHTASAHVVSVSPIQEMCGPMLPFSPSAQVDSPSQEISRPMAFQPAPAGIVSSVVSPFHETFAPMAAHALSARAEQPAQVIPGPVAPVSPSAHVDLPIEEYSRPMALHAASSRVEKPLQEISRPMAPFLTPAHVQSPLQEPYRPAAPHDSSPARIEAPFRNVVDKQTLDQEMPNQDIGEVEQPSQTGPARKTSPPSKSQTAGGSSRRNRRPSSRKPSALPPIKRKLSSEPSDPKTLKAVGIPSMFRNHRHLPAYEADGSVLYGPVAPSDDHLKFQRIEEASADKDSDMDDVSTPETPQVSSSVAGRSIRSTRSVRRQFGFSPLTTISERSESSPPTQPAKNPPPPIRFPSRTLDRMNKNKRKRWTSPESIPNPKGKSYGLGEVEFYGNAEDKQEESDFGVHQPSKVRRTSQSPSFSSQGAGNPDPSRPHGGQQSIKKTPVAITNLAGTFKVPSPGDIDWSDSQSEDEGSSQAATAQSPTIINPGPTIRPQFAVNGYEDWLQTASPAVAAVVQRMEVDPAAAGQIFESALNSNPAPTGCPIFTAYEDWRKTAPPAVTAVIDGMEVDPNMAGAAFMRGLDNPTTS